MTVTTIHGESISHGTACGPLYFILRSLAVAESPPRVASSPAGQIARFQQQVSDLSREIEQSIASLQSQSLSAEAQIMRTHLAMLQDPTFHRRVHDLVQGAHLEAESAVAHVLEEAAAKLRSSPSPILAERAADFLDLALRLKARLAPDGPYDLAAELHGIERPVLALHELLPSVVLKAGSLAVAAFIVERGTGLSHGAVLARSFSIPTVRVPSLSLLHSYATHKVLVDGYAGQVLVGPEIGNPGG